MSDIPAPYLLSVIGSVYRASIFKQNAGAMTLPGKMAGRTLLRLLLFHVLVRGGNTELFNLE
ncbi:MAG: hypothetical protein ACJ0RF_08675 [Luminiphilus sp.]